MLLFVIICDRDVVQVPFFFPVMFENWNVVYIYTKTSPAGTFLTNTKQLPSIERNHHGGESTMSYEVLLM